ncbi:MAG TPA: 2-oxoacid:acceptor oxidoreductase subunit alpha [Paludibacteraceae bacterium]|nr:2-oxoacid:acceptor oxidoreductase subunit alpha [Paludibacteraceae bacterium]
MEKQAAQNVLTNVVIRFCGDSGDGMQLTGTLFSNLSAVLGNEIATFPDYPAEIRAPQGTVGGVSGFQVHVGTGIYTPGDEADVLVAMNPAALKVNAHALKPLGVLIFDSDLFEAKQLEKAGFKTDNPFTELKLSDSIQLIPVPLTQLTHDSLKDSGLDNKLILRSKNMFALGLICWLFNRPLDQAIHFVSDKFKKNLDVLQANTKVVTDGFNYGHNLHLNISTFAISKSKDLAKGSYAIMSGNKATAWGLIAASQKSGRNLFLGSYPITPATDILHELSARKDMGVKAIQAEDEIAGICMALGASFAGDLAVTSTSGPGMSLKSEAMGLAVMAELPLVVVDVMRGGPSTGLPTKTEQTDLLQALYGRNGESPLVVMAASSPDDCFHYAFMAAKIALEHMTPVILLTDAFLGNGSSLWKLPKLTDLPEIHPHIAPESLKGQFSASSRDEKTKVRYWAFPGMEGFMHRNGGLEKDCVKASICTEPKNHARMVATRAEKIAHIATVLPEMEVEGEKTADVLILGWGSTYGHLLSATNTLNAASKRTALLHFNYISPLPKNTHTILKKYKKVVVCELNSGQFASYLRSKFPDISFLQFNKVEGQPFKVSEIVEYVETLF